MAVRAGSIFISGLKDVINMVEKVSYDRMWEATNEYRNDLITDFKHYPRTGKWYPVPGRSKITLSSGRAKPRKNPRKYQSSGPGEMPAIASGRLVKSLKMVIQKGIDLIGVVGTNVDYSIHLEYGSFKMKPRPFFWPVYRRYKEKYQSILAKRWF